MDVRITAIVLGFALLSGGAVAQDSNPNSPAYHALHNAQSPSYVGPRALDAQAQQPPQPTGYWEKTWGAIATSDTGGALGTAVGLSSKEQAEQIAMQDCQKNGGGACKIGLAYNNQCAAMLVGDGIALTRAASIEEAKADGIKACEAKGDNCRVYYSACTETVFHRY